MTRRAVPTGISSGARGGLGILAFSLVLAACTHASKSATHTTVASSTSTIALATPLLRVAQEAAITGIDAAPRVSLADTGVVFLASRSTTPANPDRVMAADAPAGPARLLARGTAAYPEISPPLASGPAVAWFASPQSGQGDQDAAWILKALVSGRERIVARSVRPGYPSMALSWPWIAWQDNTLSTQAPVIHVTDLRSSHTHDVMSGGTGLQDIDVDQLWLRADDALSHRPLDGSGSAAVFVQTPGLTESHVANGVAAWTVAPDKLHPSTATLYASRTDRYAPVVLAHHVDTCSGGVLLEGRAVPCGSYTWGFANPGPDFVAWIEPPDEQLVIAPLSAPERVTVLKRAQAGNDYGPTVVGNRVAWVELTNGGSVVYVVRIEPPQGR